MTRREYALLWIAAAFAVILPVVIVLAAHAAGRVR